MSEAYIYQAALYCECCQRDIARRLKDVPDDEREDSDRFPQGPYADGGGEADSPQHCDACNTFLENPLTHDGEKYVIEKAKEKKIDNTKDAWYLEEYTIAIWIEFYDYLELEPVSKEQKLRRIALFWLKEAEEAKSRTGFRQCDYTDDDIAEEKADCANKILEILGSEETGQ